MDIGFGRCEHAAHLVVCDVDGLDRGLRMDPSAGRFEGPLQRGDELAIVHLMIARAENPRRDVRRQERFALPRVDSRQPVNVQVKPFLQVVGEAQCFGVVPRQGHDHRALVAIIHR